MLLLCLLVTAEGPELHLGQWRMLHFKAQLSNFSHLQLQLTAFELWDTVYMSGISASHDFTDHSLMPVSTNHYV